MTKMVSLWRIAFAISGIVYHMSSPDVYASAFTPITSTRIRPPALPTQMYVSSVLGIPSASKASRNKGCIRMGLFGIGSSAASALVNHSAAAAGFFTGVRIPASLIAGSSLGTMFSLADARHNGEWDNLSISERICVKLFHSCVLVSFMLSISAIVMSTAAVITILHGHFDPTAQTAYVLLKREFEYEFSVTRWSYLTSLLSFIVGVASRAMLEFDLLKKERRFGLCGVLLCFGALLTNLLSHINSTLYSYTDYLGMTITVLKLIFLRAWARGTPLAWASLVMAVFGAFFLTAMGISDVMMAQTKDISSGDNDKTIGSNKIEDPISKDEATEDSLSIDNETYY